MQNTTTDVVQNIKSLQSAFLALKDGVERGCSILSNMVESKEDCITLNKDDSASIVSLIIFDSMIHDDCGYSILTDFDFKNDSIITKKYTDEEKCKERLKFLVNYIHYRVEYPIDIGEC